MGLPRAAEDLTAEWFAAVLPPAWFEPPERVRLERLGGLSRLVYRASFERSDGQPRGSVIVKMAPGSSAPAQPWFDRELRFYYDISADSGADVPRRYWSGSDPATGAVVLVLEDFPHHRATLEDRDATPAEARAVLAVLARLHACWWASPELQRHSFLQPHEEFVARVGAILPMALPRFLERFSEELSPTLRALAETLPERFAELAALLGAAPETLLHHDLSLRNVLLGGDAHRPAAVFIDWELVRRGPAVRDVSYFLGTSTPPGSDDELVAFYHGQLATNGVSGYPLDRLRDDYRRSVVCDLARMVMTAGRPSLAPGMAAVVARQLRRRATFDAAGLL